MLGVVGGVTLLLQVRTNSAHLTRPGSWGRFPSTVTRGQKRHPTRTLPRTRSAVNCCDDTDLYQGIVCRSVQIAPRPTPRAFASGGREAQARVLLKGSRS